MKRLATSMKGLLRDVRAATAVEYGLILALVVLAVIASVAELASVTSSMWNNVSAEVQKAG